MTDCVSSEKITHEQLNINGLSIHVQEWGEGEPLLLYSGIWGEVGLWEGLLPHLEGFRAIAFDPPGIGRSPLARVPTGMKGLARLGTAVLDRLGVDSAHVLGVSFGGAVAQQMAFSHPERVRRLVLVSTSFGALSVPGDLMALLHFMHPRSYHPLRLERLAGTMFGGRLRTEPELLRSVEMKRPGSPLAVLHRLAPVLSGWTSLPWLRAISHQTLVIAGDDDPVTPHVNHRVMAALIPRARLHTVSGGGHLVLLDSAAHVGPVITSFLRHGGDAAQAPDAPADTAAAGAAVPAEAAVLPAGVTPVPADAAGVHPAGVAAVPRDPGALPDAVVPRSGEVVPDAEVLPADAPVLPA